jgi:hypothetical protein
MAGEGPPNPSEYLQPGRVDRHLIEDVASWVATLPPASG